jgi:hypothetical protein
MPSSCLIAVFLFFGFFFFCFSKKFFLLFRCFLTHTKKIQCNHKATPPPSPFCLAPLTSIPGPQPLGL